MRPALNLFAKQPHAIRRTLTQFTRPAAPHERPILFIGDDIDCKAPSTQCSTVFTLDSLYQNTEDKLRQSPAKLNIIFHTHGGEESEGTTVMVGDIMIGGNGISKEGLIRRLYKNVPQLAQVKLNVTFVACGAGAQILMDPAAPAFLQDEVDQHKNLDVLIYGGKFSVFRQYANRFVDYHLDAISSETPKPKWLSHALLGGYATTFKILKPGQGIVSTLSLKNVPNVEQVLKQDEQVVKDSWKSFCRSEISRLYNFFGERFPQEDYADIKDEALSNIAKAVVTYKTSNDRSQTVGLYLGLPRSIFDPNYVDPLMRATPFYLACNLGFREMAERFLKAGIDMNKGAYFEYKGNPDFHISPAYGACDNGREEILTLLFANGLKAEITSTDVEQPFMAACRKKDRSLVKIFLKEALKNPQEYNFDKILQAYSAMLEESEDANFVAEFLPILFAASEKLELLEEDLKALESGSSNAVQYLAEYRAHQVAEQLKTKIIPALLQGDAPIRETLKAHGIKIEYSESKSVFGEIYETRTEIFLGNKGVIFKRETGITQSQFVEKTEENGALHSSNLDYKFLQELLNILNKAAEKSKPAALVQIDKAASLSENTKVLSK